MVGSGEGAPSGRTPGGGGGDGGDRGGGASQHRDAVVGGSGAAELLGGMYGSGGEYEVVTPTDAGAALGSLAGTVIGSVGAGVVGASLGASAAAVTGAAGMGAALGAVLGHSFGGAVGGGTAAGHRKGDVDGGDVPLLGEEDVAIERRSRALEGESRSAREVGPGEAGPAAGNGEGEGEAGAAGLLEEVPELLGLQPLCEMGVNAGLYLGHGHTVAVQQSVEGAGAAGVDG